MSAVATTSQYAAMRRLRELAQDPTRRHVAGSRVLNWPLALAVRVAFGTGVSVRELAEACDSSDHAIEDVIAGRRFTQPPRSRRDAYRGLAHAT